MKINSSGLDWGSKTNIAHKGSYPPPAQDQVKLARLWIRLFGAPRKTKNTKYSSYSLKHTAERRMGGYISNGAFIKAAMLEGYEVFPTREFSTNAYFNMSIAKWWRTEQKERKCRLS